jgi:hypothetical protein
MTRFPYKVNTKHLYPEVCAWCKEHVGKFDHDWTIFWNGMFDPDATETYYFAQEKHAMWFRLRWA